MTTPALPALTADECEARALSWSTSVAQNADSFTRIHATLAHLLRTVAALEQRTPAREEGRREDRTKPPDGYSVWFGEHSDRFHWDTPSAPSPCHLTVGATTCPKTEAEAIAACWAHHDAQAPSAPVEPRECPWCDGTGRDGKSPCVDCHGSGIARAPSPEPASALSYVLGNTGLCRHSVMQRTCALCNKERNDATRSERDAVSGGGHGAGGMSGEGDPRPRGLLQRGSGDEATNAGRREVHAADAERETSGARQGVGHEAPAVEPAPAAEPAPSGELSEAERERLGRLAFEAYSFVRAKYGLDDSWDDAGVKTRAVCVDVVRIGHTAGVAAERAKWEHDRDCRQHALDTARIEVARHEQIVRMHRAELDAARGLRAELARLRERERVLIDCVHAASDALGNVVSTPGGNVDNAKNALDPVRLWSYPAAAPEATLQARLDAATECERLRGEVAGLREHMRSVIAAYDDDATSHRISPAHEAARAVALRTAVEDARTALAKPTAAPEAARGGEKG